MSWLLTAPKPMTWLRCRLQGDGLCQADEGLDAEQVGQHHRLLCQELVKGQHSVCSRQMPFLPPTSLLAASGLLVGSKVVSRSPIRLATPWQHEENSRPIFQGRSLLQTLPVLVKSSALAVKNATRACIKEKVVKVFQRPGRPPFHWRFAQKVS